MINGGGGGGGGSFSPALVPLGTMGATKTANALKPITTFTGTLPASTTSPTCAITLTGMVSGWQSTFALQQNAAGVGGVTVTINGASVPVNQAPTSLSTIDVYYDGTNYYISSPDVGIQSVNGKTGQTVTLAASDVGALGNTTDLHTLSIGNPATGAVSFNNQQATNLPNGAAAGNALAYGQAPITQATTGVAGYTLVNGTGTIYTWTAPNDGNLHSFKIEAVLIVSVAETGGGILLGVTNPNGGPAYSVSVYTTNQSTGTKFPASSTGSDFVVGPGGVVTLSQNTALTAGASILYSNLEAM